MEVSSETAEYFHPDFHNSMNMGIDCVGEQHGEAELKAYLRLYTEHVYVPVFRAMENGAMKAIEDKIRETYRLEKAEDVLTIENDGTTMTVTITYCLAMKHLHSLGKTLSKWYRYSTETVMETLAAHGGLSFTMDAYDEETGAAKYTFRA